VTKFHPLPGGEGRGEGKRKTRPKPSGRLSQINKVKSIFSKNSKLFIGVVHLAPLPGSPRWNGNLERLIEAAVNDARAYERGGAHAVFVENFGDVPFTKSNVAPETLTSMTAAGRAIRAAVKIPIGFNVLRNDARAALALCAACDGNFIRVNIHTGAMLTDQGIIEGDAYETLRYRARVCPGAEILADVHVKHAVPLGNWPLDIAARDTLERGLADALIVSGTGTGEAAEVSDLETVRRACPSAKILLGSGVTAENVHEYSQADGFIVGSSLKREGKLANPVDAKRVMRLARAIHA
jgi:membrane complex biogenesis BtpA family protein